MRVNHVVEPRERWDAHWKCHDATRGRVTRRHLYALDQDEGDNKNLVTDVISTPEQHVNIGSRSTGLSRPHTRFRGTFSGQHANVRT